MTHRKQHDFFSTYIRKPKTRSQETKKLKFLKEYMIRHDLFSGATIYEMKTFRLVSSSGEVYDKPNIDGILTIVLYDIPNKRVRVDDNTLKYIKKISRTYFDLKFRNVQYQIILNIYDPMLYPKKNWVSRFLSVFNFFAKR